MTSSQANQTSDQVSPGCLLFFDMCLSTVQNFILFAEENYFGVFFRQLHYIEKQPLAFIWLRFLRGWIQPFWHARKIFYNNSGRGYFVIFSKKLNYHNEKFQLFDSKEFLLFWNNVSNLLSNKHWWSVGAWCEPSWSPSNSCIVVYHFPSSISLSHILLLLISFNNYYMWSNNYYRGSAICQRVRVIWFPRSCPRRRHDC